MITCKSVVHNYNHAWHMIEAMIIFVLLKAFFDRHNFIYHFIRLWNSFLQNITCFINLSLCLQSDWVNYLL